MCDGDPPQAPTGVAQLPGGLSLGSWGLASPGGGAAHTCQALGASTDNFSCWGWGDKYPRFGRYVSHDELILMNVPYANLEGHAVLNPGGPQKSPAHDYTLPWLFSPHCPPVPSLTHSVVSWEHLPNEGPVSNPLFQNLFGGK